MTPSVALPAYDSLDLSHHLPPTYDPGPQLAPTFKIGSSFTLPLVSIQEVKAHLQVLGAFHRLREQVRAAVPNEREYGEEGLREDVKWCLYLQRAVHRFELWMQKVVRKPERTRGEITALLDDEVPPLDVLLVFHGYLLNPHNYFEDTTLYFPELALIGGFPFSQITSHLDPPTYEYVPTASQADEWELATLESFELSYVPSLDDDAVTLTCPVCGNSNITAPWLAIPRVTTTSTSSSGHSDSGNERDEVTTIKVEGIGFAQRSFRTKCLTCETMITRDTICANKLATDIARVIESHSRRKESRLANTLISPHDSTAAPRLSNQFAECVVSALQVFNPEVSTRLDIGEMFKWSVEEGQKVIERGLKVLGPRMWMGEMIGRMMRAYRQPSAFSLDLVGAVLRQFQFTSKIYSLGFTSPTSLSTPSDTIIPSLYKYHSFLDLLSQDPIKVLVPTVEIDLSWHTHMLKAERYKSDVEVFVGRFVGHDDKVEEGKLAAAYDETLRAWRTRFSSSPLTTDISQPSTSSQKLLFWKRSRSLSTSSDVPAACPSEHSSIVILYARRSVEQARKNRELKAGIGGPFARKLEDGPQGWDAIGKDGWDLSGVREGGEGVIDQRELRGDCCSGATLSHSSIGYLEARTPASAYLGSLMR